MERKLLLFIKMIISDGSYSSLAGEVLVLSNGVKIEVYCYEVRPVFRSDKDLWE